MPRLIVTEGVDEGKQFDVNDPVVVIGREANSTVRLLDTEVSRRHAEVRKEGGIFRIHDLASANGVYLNGRPVTIAELHSGDRIQIGATTLVFGGAPSEPVPSQRQLVVARTGDDLPSAIIRKIDASEGSQILARAGDARSPWLRTRLANLGIMYEAIQAVSHILDLDQLLEKILELLFRSVEADRGCFLIQESPETPLVARAVRWREGAGPRDEIAVSRTIIDHALREREGLLVADAGQDDRFRAGASVVRLGIREAICVPMTGRRETIGVLYFDTIRSVREAAAPPEATKFTEDHLALAIAVAHQAAIAVEETRYYQAMVQAERLAAVGQAIASLSHHIKNILQGMRSGADVLRIGIDEKDDAATQTGLRLIERNQTRIFDLVLDMLSYSKEREPEKEPADAAKLVDEVMELMRPRAIERGVTLRAECDALPTMLVDPEGIHRALLNLVTNALDAVEDAEQPEIVIQCAVESGNQWLRLAVRDNGVGIEPQRIASLFKPFQSTKGSRGTGLGLAVSRKILREHGGDILVTSQPGAGSEFVLRIPLGGTQRSEPTSCRQSLTEGIAKS